MNRKKILFVMPLVRPGGVGTSLSSIYTLLDLDKYDVSVFPVANVGLSIRDQLSYNSCVLPYDLLLSAYYGSLDSYKGVRKSFIALFKMIFRILAISKINIEEYLIERAVNKIELGNKFDTVVGFMEGYTTKVASFFHCDNKIAWVHCNYNMHLPMNKSEERLYEKFDHIISVSQYTTRVFQERYPSLAFKTSCIYNPLDTSRVLRLSEEPIDDDRFSNRDFCIISVGRVATVKRFDKIPQIASRLKTDGLRFKWYIIGPCYSVQEESSLISEIKKYAISDYVIWLGGKKNPYPYFKAASLFVSTSESEACPMVFNEARILNLPIVSTNFPSAYEFIEDGVDGIIRPIDNLSEGICRMMTDSDFYNMLKENGKCFCYDNSEIINNLNAIL